MACAGLIVMHVCFNMYTAYTLRCAVCINMCVVKVGGIISISQGL